MALNSGVHFVAKTILQVFDSSTTLRFVVETLRNSKRRSFIMLAGRTEYYVKAQQLLYYLDADWPENEETYLSNDLRDLLLDYPQAFIRIVSAPPGATSQTLLANHERVYKIGSEGYFFTSNALLATMSGPLFYICKNPKRPHRNYDPDASICRYCPYEIKKDTTAAS